MLPPPQLHTVIQYLQQELWHSSTEASTGMDEWKKQNNISDDTLNIV